MSGLKPPEMSAFYAEIHARGLTTAILAERIGISRPALCRVLNGSRRRGPIWRRILGHLTPAEIALLDVAQCSPWNARRLARRPRWSDALRDKFTAISA